MLEPITTDNAASLVLEVGAERARTLLTADADSLVESRLEVFPEVAILKVSHHGSASSSGANFLGRLRPRHAIVSAGRWNPFGHPSPGALRRLAACGARLHRTDLEGALWFELDESGARPIDWRAGEPRLTFARRPPPPEAAMGALRLN